MAEIAGRLTEAEQAYFDSRGEAELPADEQADTPEPEPEPEPVADDEPEDDGGEGAPQKTVPYGALKEERDRRKREAEEKAAAIRERDELRRQLEDARKAKADPKPDEDPEPDSTNDPVGHIQWQQRQIMKREQEREARERDDLARQEFARKAASDQKAFEADHPDYGAALTHARATRLRQLQRTGLDQQQAIQQLHVEEIGLAFVAWKQGKNSAEMIYDWATDYGYRKAEPKPAPAAAEIKRKQEAAAAATSLSKAGGAANDTKSMEDIAKLSGAALHTTVKSMTDAEWRRLNGL